APKLDALLHPVRAIARAQLAVRLEVEELDDLLAPIAMPDLLAPQPERRREQVPAEMPVPPDQEIFHHRHPEEETQVRKRTRDPAARDLVRREAEQGRAVEGDGTGA